MLGVDVHGGGGLRPPVPAPSPAADAWRLEPGLVYLNHGSFGACPTPVLEAQARHRALMESDAVEFFVSRQWQLLDDARRALCPLLGLPPTDFDALAPITNATTAVATALAHEASTGRLTAGDELLCTSHEYLACRNNLERTAEQTRTRVVVASLPFPCSSPAEIIDAILAAVTPRTRLALISHVTSATGLVLPVETIVPELERRGIRVILDGAHGVGMLPIDLPRLSPSYYASNCHKWLCAPKGAAVLYAREDIRPTLRPLVLSNNARSPRPGRAQFLTEFDYCGTSDPTAFMAVADAAAFLPTLLPAVEPNAEPTWDALMARNHAVCVEARSRLCAALDVLPPAPARMLSCIATIILPQHPPQIQERLRGRPTRFSDPLQDALRDRHHIQVPVWSLPHRSDRFLRISTQLYNTPAQYEWLLAAVLEELQAERRLAGG